MNTFTSLLLRRWLLILACATGFLVWMTMVRIERVRYVTGVAQDQTALSGISPTGFAGGIRQLIVPEHIERTYQWIAQTQQMLASHEWRLRRIDYENAPFGHEVHTASAYRWWLGLLASVDHLICGVSPGAAVERAAYYADPVLHFLLLISMAVYCARYFQPAAAIGASLGVISLYPFAAGFLPGCPDDFSLLLMIAPWCVLPLLVALSPARSAPSEGNAASAAAPHRFFLAGMVGGVGLWLSVAIQLPILVGVALGGILVACVERHAGRRQGTHDGSLVGWRLWALGGASTVLVLYLLEYAPAYLGGWELRVIHPLYGLAWLGLAEILGRTADCITLGRAPRGAGAFTAIVVSLAALVAVPVIMAKTGNQGYLAADLLSFRLTKLPDGIMAPNLPGWFSAGGAVAPLWATLLPLLVPLVAILLIFQRSTGAWRRALALAVGPVVVALALAYFHLRWWQLFGGLSLALLAAMAAVIWGSEKPCWWRWVGRAIAAVICISGLVQLLPLLGANAKNVLTVAEVEGLVERDLAHWLAANTGRTEGGPVVLAPPSIATALNYYGGLPGLGTLSWENKDGLAVALRIVISTSREEALALIRQRGVTHIVIPSWDNFFESYKQSSSMQTSELFLVGLDRWSLPLWLRPLPYQLPGVAGFENQSVRIFEVVEEQDDAVAVGRLTEYFIEMGQLENAKVAGQLLNQYPADFNALIARAQLEAALIDAPAFTAVFDPLIQRLNAGADRYLIWERRVSLAVVLARGKRMDLARSQVQRCFAEIDEVRLRSLTAYSRYHLLVMAKALNLEIPDQHLRSLAFELVPSELRARL